jgi:hypothetical protein
MISANDISRSAWQLIKQHGDQAEAYAIERYNSLLESEDMKGAGTWMAIIQNIKLLRAPSSYTIH